MPADPKLNDPWLVAVWPGMGHVAVNAGYYLMAKLHMDVLAELPADEFFDAEHVDVEHGLIRAGGLPRSRFFVWRDPAERHDVIVFLGEAQPPTGKYAFCRRLVEFAKELGVRRMFTFAAMATQMHPEQVSRVFAAATDGESLSELQPLNVEVLESGHISGLNGVVLGVAAEQGLSGACLLGEMPHVFANVPFPKASLAVLEVFTDLAGTAIDLDELAEQARVMEQKLGEVLDRVQETMGTPFPEAEDEEYVPEPVEEERLAPEDEARLERLFADAERDRSKAYELKGELDRLDVFGDYEDRFLDLFSRPE